MVAHYDDPSFSYDHYWKGRDYEHQAELAALSRLLSGHKFKRAADIGGGYGRLTRHLTAYASRISLIEPSQKQRRIAQSFLPPSSQLTVLPGSAQRTRLDSDSLDLVVMVRVMHHLPDPTAALSELFRVLRPGGTLVLEFANSYNFKARFTSFLTGQPILPAPLDRRSQANIRRHTIPFVNHHPHTVFKLLTKSGFAIDRILSVSNFRSSFIKRWLPQAWLLQLESWLQIPLARHYFGPSLFVLAHKPK